MNYLIRKTIWSVMLAFAAFTTVPGRASEPVKHYEPTWNSLCTWKTPQWLRDGKFGIYTHWGVYSVPAQGPNATWYSVFPSWNHWPTSQINSSGRNTSFPDRAAHSSISHLFWLVSAQLRGKVAYQEKILMEGMTDQPATALVGLAKSWLNAPSVTNVFGGSCQGYEQGRRAYSFGWGIVPLRFQIAASDTNPIHNLCFEIKNWTGRTAEAALKINDVSQAPGPDFRQGVNIDTDGTYGLIVWVGMSANTIL
jgi:hypothetical protein